MQNVWTYKQSSFICMQTVQFSIQTLNLEENVNNYIIFDVRLNSNFRKSKSKITASKYQFHSIKLFSDSKKHI